MRAPTIAFSWLYRMLLMGLATVMAGWLGLQIPGPTVHHPIVAPLTALAFAMLLRWGSSVWLPLITGVVSLYTSVLVSGPLTSDAVANAVAWIVSCTVAPGLGVHFYRQAVPRGPIIETLHVPRLTAAALLTATTAIASQSVSWLIQSGWQPLLWVGLTLMGVLRDTVSCVILPLMALHWSTDPRALGTILRKHWRPTLHALGACTLTWALAYWGLTQPAPPALTWLWSGLIFLLVAWIATRSLSAASAALLGILLVAVAPVVSGYSLTPSGQAPDTTDVAWYWSMIWAYLAFLTVLIWWVHAQAKQGTAVHTRWLQTLDQTDIGIAQWFLDTDEMHLSKRWWALLGHDEPQPPQSSRAVWLRIHDNDRNPMREFLLNLSEHNSRVGPVEFRMQSVQTEWVWLQCHAVLDQLTASGQPLRITLIVRDVSLQRTATEKQQLSDTIFEHLHEALLITDGQFRALDCNARFSQLLGCRREEVLHRIPALLKPLVEPGTPNAMPTDLLLHGRWRGEIRTRDTLGRGVVFQATATATHMQGELRLCAFVLSDITAQLRQKEQLERQAHFDELTGLPNRVSLGTLLREALQASEREGFLLTICSFDVDYFKQLNDKLGHASADSLLQALAQRLTKTLATPPDNMPAVARLGGDEFALLIRSATLEQSRRTVERVLRSVALPFELPDVMQAVTLTGSIGATVYPVDAADADTLLRHADQAMYRAKQAGRNGYLYFDAELDRQKEARFEALARVQHALADEQFVLYFQPKVNMRLGKVLGVEALLRWKHPRHGVIPPAQFLPLIEPTPLSEEVGDWVLDKGIDQLASWLRMGLQLTLSINVSARHLQSPSFKQRLTECLAPHPEAVGRSLILEVLETAALADIDYTSQLMNECKALGVRFALDDFGTGYSTLTYLKRLPLDLLKIDRSFVHNMLNDSQDMAIVQGVIGLSHTFGCVVVAEGVETLEQAQQLIAAGCEIGQGNGIAKAMPGEEVPLWIKNYRGAVQLSSP